MIVGGVMLRAPAGVGLGRPGVFDRGDEGHRRPRLYSVHLVPVSLLKLLGVYQKRKSVVV